MTQAGISICAIAGIFFEIAAVSGQPANSPQFDAVEVRVAKALPPGTDITYSTNAIGRLVQVRIEGGTGLPHVTPVFGSDGRVIVQAATMRQLIEVAYKEVIGQDYLAGGPHWIDSDRFDLIAKAPPNTSVDAERLMIQGVLATRFHLQLHSEDKPMPVYALVVGKKGPKVSPAASGGPEACRAHDMGNSPGDGIHYSCQRLTMTGLAEWLPRRASGYVDLPVVNLTEMTGAYDFQLDWSPRMSGADSSEGVTIFRALEEQLGLRLERRKHPMPTIVIDRVDRVPTVD